MAIQAILPDGRKYSPARDLVYVYPEIVKDAMRKMSLRQFSGIHEFVEANGVTEADIDAACTALVQFYTTVVDDPDETCADILRRVGWFDTKPLARMLLVAYIGTDITGAFFDGIRNVLMLNEKLPEHVASLINTAPMFELYTSDGFFTRAGRWVDRLLGLSK